MHVIHVSQTSDVENLLKNLQLSTHEASVFIKRFENYFPITIVHEPDYYDRDWTSMLAEHYSSIFGQFPRVVDRLHIFSGQIERPEVLFNTKDYQDSYFGFLTVYPCRPRCFGRSLLSVDKFNLKPGILSCKNTVHIAGTPLNINAFPFSGQDAKLLSCAHVAIWQVVRYFSTKYGYYGEYCQADISKVCENPSFGRAVPTRGLHWTQMLAGLNSLRLRPILYDTTANLTQRAKDYLTSGIPVILGGVHSSGEGHAVVGIGLDNPSDVTQSNIIVNDDNFLPYGVMSSSPNNCSINISDLRFVIAPLYSKIVIPIETSEKHAELIQSDNQFGITAHGIPANIRKRVFLTSSRTYKQELCGRSHLGVFELLARTEGFPKFVWIVEYFEESTPDKVIAEYVLDATTSTYDWQSFILLKYQNRVWKNERTQGQKNNIVFFDTPAIQAWNAFRGNLFR